MPQRRDEPTMPLEPELADYRAIVRHYERCLLCYGPTTRGMDWPDEQDALTRYDVMLGLVPAGQPASVLDLGCGVGLLRSRMLATGRRELRYTGIDLSEEMVRTARAQHPEEEFRCLDVLTADADPGLHDYVVMNGLFTERGESSREAMLAYLEQLLTKIWAHTRRGMAFNVMSVHVDWEREDLFHVPYDTMAGLLRARISRHFVFRADYGLHEYTVYVHREPVRR